MMTEQTLADLCDRVETLAEIRRLVSQRRSMAAALPSYTMRDDPRVHAMQEVEVKVITLASKVGIKEKELWEAIS